MPEPPPMPDLDGGVKGCYLFIAATKAETVARHSFLRGWLGPEAARLLPSEYVGTSEQAAPRGSAAERGTAVLVLLSRLVLHKLYTVARLAHELKLEPPLSRLYVARCDREAISRTQRHKGLPGGNTFSHNAHNPMPHQVFVTEHLVGAAAASDAIIQKLKKAQRMSKGRGVPGSSILALSRESAAMLIVIQARAFLKLRRNSGRRGNDDDDEAPPPSFGGPPLSGKHDAPPGERFGADYWRQRTALAIADAHTAASSWHEILTS